MRTFVFVYGGYYSRWGRLYSGSLNSQWLLFLMDWVSIQVLRLRLIFMRSPKRITFPCASIMFIIVFYTNELIPFIYSNRSDSFGICVSSQIEYTRYIR